MIPTNSPAAIRRLIDQYGNDARLSRVLHEESTGMPHVCVKCHGQGFIFRNINTCNRHKLGHYIARVQCDLCNGYGNTKHEYEARPTNVEYVRKLKH